MYVCVSEGKDEKRGRQTCNFQWVERSLCFWEREEREREWMCEREGQRVIGREIGRERGRESVCVWVWVCAILCHEEKDNRLKTCRISSERERGQIQIKVIKGDISLTFLSLRRDLMIQILRQNENNILSFSSRSNQCGTKREKKQLFPREHNKLKGKRGHDIQSLSAWLKFFFFKSKQRYLIATHLLLNINWRMLFNAFRWICEELQFTISFWASPPPLLLGGVFVIDLTSSSVLLCLIKVIWFDSVSL